MRFVVDGTDGSLVRDILSNIIAQEKDENMKTLKTIQAGDNPRFLLMKLNSLTDFSLKEDAVLRKYLE